MNPHWKRIGSNVGAVLSCALVLSLPAAGAEKKPYGVHGTWIEGCSCSAVCSCEINGLVRGCEGVGVALIDSGSYGGVDLSGARIAFGLGAGKWVRIYIQAKDAAQYKAAESVGRGMMAAFGKVESARKAKVDVAGANGSYKVTVDGGKLFSLTTKPILGADKKTPIAIQNYPDLLNHTMMQATVVSGAYHDGPHQFTLKGTNSFFDPDMQGSGSL